MISFRNFVISLAFLLVVATGATYVHAHPHVYVDTSLTFRVDDSGLVSMHENWVFDEIFTNAILADLELTPDSLVTTLGQEKIREGAFAYLANFGYFTFLENGGEKLSVAKPEGFLASLKEGRLMYDFTLPINLSFDQIKNFKVAVFDKEYYADILLMKEAIAFEVDGMAQVSHVVRPAKEHTYWQFIVPQMVHLSLSNSPGSDTNLPEQEMVEVEQPGPIERVMASVRTIQKELTLKLNGFGMDIKDDPFGPALWMFLAMSFLYGIVHAVGPGHGKAVVCSYFLANPGSFASGALMGNVITFVHMGSAALAVGIAYAVFSTGMGGFAAASRAIQPASYALLTGMGLFLAIKAIRDVMKGGMIADTSCPIDHAEVAGAQNTRRVLTVSFITGLIPCPGAAVILAFAIGLNIFWAGVAALFVMAVGMGITTTLFAWGAVAARGVTLKLSGKNKKFFNWVYAALSIGGASAIALFGGLLLWSSDFWHNFL